MTARDEVYEVKIRRDIATGIAVTESWRNQKGSRDRSDGPAEIRRDPVTGIVTNEAWFQNGELSRADGPALVTRNGDTGDTKYSAWYREGEKIRAPKRNRSRSAATQTNGSPTLG